MMLSKNIQGPVCNTTGLDEISYQSSLDEINQQLQNQDIETAFENMHKLMDHPLLKSNDSYNAGLIARSLEHINDAARFFEKAIEIDSDNIEALHNFALLEIERSNFKEAEELFGRIMEIDRNNPVLYNDLAVVYENLSDYSQALDSWRKGLMIDPNNSGIRNNAVQFCLEKKLHNDAVKFLKLNSADKNLTAKSKSEIDHWLKTIESFSEQAGKPVEVISQKVGIKNAKIAVFAALDSFIKDISSYLEEDNEVQYFDGSDSREMLRLMEWADIAWFEWCDQYLIEASTLPKVCKIVCRIHSYEVFTEMPQQVNWVNVDQIIFVNESVRQLFNMVNKISAYQSVVHNALNLNHYKLEEQKNYGKKIASVGYINYKKNPTLLLYCFKKIYEYDNEYSLHIAGDYQDSRIKLYIEHFLHKNPLPIHFDGWVENMQDWYKDKDFVISTSLFESFHYSIAEGMASGLIPLIHNWYGAENLYPEKYMFSDPDDCLRLIKEIEKSDKRIMALENREFIEQRYDMDDKNREISKILKQVIDDESK